jgi:translation initiation factor IF-3
LHAEGDRFESDRLHHFQLRRTYLKKVQFSLTTSGADLVRKCNQIDKFLLAGEEVRVSVEVKRGQGRVFDTTLTKLLEITGMLVNAKNVAPPSQKGKGWQTLIR